MYPIYFIAQCFVGKDNVTEGPGRMSRRGKLKTRMDITRKIRLWFWNLYLAGEFFQSMKMEREKWKRERVTKCKHLSIDEPMLISVTDGFVHKAVWVQWMETTDYQLWVFWSENTISVWFWITKLITFIKFSLSVGYIRLWTVPAFWWSPLR